MRKAALCGLVVGATLAGLGPGWAQAPIVVNVGAASTTSDAPIYIADKKGYFREEGLEAKVTNFRSAADMVAPLGIGQLDAGAGSASAGLYNAMLQGIKIKIVADKASSAPGYGATKILVRKDLVDSGRFKTIKDFKGMKFAMNAPGVSNTATLNALLEIGRAQIFRRRDGKPAVPRPRGSPQQQGGRRLCLGRARPDHRRSRTALPSW